MRKLLIPVLLAGLPLPLAAQSNVEGRVGKLESEMRAVQRKVFGTTAPLIQPDVAAPVQPVGPGPGTPASSAIVDVTARVAALETQIASLTGQVEQNQNQLRRLQDAFDAYRSANDTRIRAIEAPTTSVTPARGLNGDVPVEAVPSRPTTRPAPVPTTRPAVTTSPKADGPHTDRVAAVARPATGDAPEDEYLYGYRLWAAKLYPEAETQLKKVAADYPKHRRASYARNLLGRSYLDDGKPSLASVTFYDNYKTLPDGERAPESLYYLAQALVTLKKPADACKVYGELTDVYGTRIAASMKADIARGRTAARCAG